MIQNVSRNEQTPATAATERSTSIEKNKHKTSITPFEKVLAGASEKASNPMPDTFGTSPDGVVVKTARQAQNEAAASSGNAELDSIFKRASQKYGVPYVFLIAVAKAESNFRVNATSKSGAQGIMQLMPATAKSLGVADAYDPEQNIMAGAKYLASHLKEFHGDMDLAAAAYNAGGAAVKKYGGVPPYRETQNYVKTIQKYMKQGVTVPERTVKTSTTGASDKISQNQKTTGVDNSVAATEEDFNNSTVVVGTGEHAVTMTYGAYLRYLELGSTGVG